MRRSYVVPAQPNWVVLDRIVDTATGEVVGLHENPVLAWSVSVEPGDVHEAELLFEVEPICAVNLSPELERPLLRPDCQVIGITATWASKAAYFAYIRDPDRLD